MRRWMISCSAADSHPSGYRRSGSSGQKLWRAMLPLILAILLAKPHQLIGQETPGRQSTASVVPPEVAQLEIALGRLRLVPDKFRIIRKHEQTPERTPENAPSATATDPNDVAPVEAEAIERSMQVSVSDGRPTLRLSYRDRQERWTLQIDSLIGAEWTRQYQHAGQPVRIEYVQRPRQPITITIHQANHSPQQLKGQSLWHLTDDNSPEFTSFVVPALERLNPSWNLPAALATAKRIRQNSGLECPEACQHALANLITQLDSDDYSVRTTALQKLKDAGLAAQIPLERLRSQSLSASQRSAIEQLLADLEPHNADTPTRLAYWLSGDPAWQR